MAVTAVQRSGALAGGGNIWENLVKSGSIKGDYNYYKDSKAKPQEYQNLLSQGLASSDRKSVVDYLFDTGAAQGDRNYWYENRGAEDMNLALSLGGAAPSSVVPGAPQARDIDTLRAERLQSALEAIRAQTAYQGGELKGQIAQLGNLYEQGTADIARRTELGVEDTENRFTERGLERSGFFGTGMARTLGGFAEEQGALEGSIGNKPGSEGTEIRALMSAIAMLGQQNASAESQAKLDSEQEELDLVQLIALTQAGLV